MESWFSLQLWNFSPRWNLQLLIYGPGTVVPSTLKVLTPGLEYSIQVALSTQSPTGKVTITTAKKFCSDAAGNLYQRTSNSSVVIRFSKCNHCLFLFSILDSKVNTKSSFQTLVTYFCYLDIQCGAHYSRSQCYFDKNREINPCSMQDTIWYMGCIVFTWVLKLLSKRQSEPKWWSRSAMLASSLRAQ